MYKLCKTEQSAARQRRMELGLLEAMESRYYEEISVSDLCQQMGISRKSFYRYFSGKEGALHALIDHTFTEYDRNSSWLLFEEHSIQMELEALFRFWKEQKKLMDALQRSGLSSLLMERAIRIGLDVAGMRENRERMYLLTAGAYTAVFASCGLMSMIVQWHHSGYALSVGQMASVAAGILTGPLLEEK